ncbi:MAG: hypothetical protein JSR91_22075 [Proteobacteria bacterium]|nr:hypothetical protein [Pseudomonadota bacterium]
MARCRTEFQRFQPLAARLQVVHGLRALVSPFKHACREDIPLRTLAKTDILGPERDARRVSGRERLRRPGFDAAHAAKIDGRCLAAARQHLAAQDIRGAREVGDERIGWLVVDLAGRRHLQQVAVTHHADAVTQHDGLGLVVGERPVMPGCYACFSLVALRVLCRASR